MNTTRLCALVTGGVALTLGSVALGAPTPDTKATARTLVVQAADIKPGDLVLVTGQPRDTELLEQVAIEVRKQGAFPLLAIESETLARRMFDEVPAKFDTQTDAFGLKLAGMINAAISVDGTENPALFANASPARMAARTKAQTPIHDAMLQHNVRQVSLGNGLYPTQATAKQFGLSQDELATIFWNAVNTDYSKLQNTGATVKQTLAAGRQVEITNPNGTNIRFQIQSRPVFVSDGVIGPEDTAKGGAACQAWLPAGEAYTAPVAGTAEGTVVVDRMFFQGNEVTNLKLTFRGGKLTEMTATNGLAPLKAYYDAQTGAKDAFGFLDIGLNESMRIPQNSKLLSWIPAGMVTVGIGENSWAGGNNDASADLSFFLPGSTLKVDGKTLVDKGRLTP